MIPTELIWAKKSITHVTSSSWSLIQASINIQFEGELKGNENDKLKVTSARQCSCMRDRKLDTLIDRQENM